MSIKSNHTVAQIKEGIRYYKGQLKEHKGTQFERMIERDIEKYQGFLKEANERIVIGTDDKGANVYITADGVVRVEGKPSGWKFEKEQLVSGSQFKVCYDGGTHWFGKITIK